MIKATGKKDGEKMTVEYDNGKFLFNGIDDVYYTDELEYELSLTHAVGGTYFPQKDEPLNILNVLENYFFDEHADVETDEQIEEMESEYGRIY